MINDAFEELRSSLQAAQQNGITEVTIETRTFDSVVSSLTSALAHIGYLRESLSKILDTQEDTHPGECHCVYCNARHAMSVTGGYKKKDPTDEQGQ